MLKSNKLNEYLSDRTQEKILDNFTRATGINLLIKNIDGEQLSPKSKNSRLWLAIAESKQIIDQCERNLREKLSHCIQTGQIQIFNRYLDTLTFIVPIYIEGRVMAFFNSGLSRTGNPKPHLCAIEAEKLGVELDDYLEMYLELPLVTPEKFEATANLLKIITTTITTLSKEENEIKNKISQISSINDFLKQEIKNNSSELKLSEIRYFHLFNNINDGAYIADINGVIIEMNTCGAKMLGYGSHELVGSNLMDIFFNSHNRDKLIVKEILKNGYLQNRFPYVRLKDGKIDRFETNVIAIRDDTGDVIGIQGIFRETKLPAKTAKQSTLFNNRQREHYPLRKETTPDESKNSFIHGIKNHQETPEKT